MENQIIDTAIKKLSKEEDKTPAAKVFVEYLKCKCKADVELAENINKPDKSLAGMIDYIKVEAKKKATNGFCAVEDKVVFKWAESYFGIKNPDINENDIEAVAQAVSKGASTTITEKQKKFKKESQVPEGQTSLFDFLGADI